MSSSELQQARNINVHVFRESEKVRTTDLVNQGFINSRNSRKGSHDSRLPLGVARTPPEKYSRYEQQGCLTLLGKVASLKQRETNSPSSTPQSEV